MPLETLQIETLWSEPVLGVRPLHPGYEDHASEVWEVTTSSGQCILRRSRCDEVPEVDFWWGAHHLFGLDPSDLGDLQQVLIWLSEEPQIQVPGLLGLERVKGSAYLVVEKLQGQTLRSFLDQPDQVLHDLGVLMARIHLHTFEAWGHLSGRVYRPLEQFHVKMLETAALLIEKFHPAEEFRTCLETVKPLADLPVTEASLVMLDQDPTQYLQHQGRLSGIVDVEACVVAPPALDLIGLEYVLDERTARAFRSGYRSIRPLPDLQQVRPLYRLFCRLLSIQGKVPLEDWMGHPAFLDEWN